MRNARMKSVGSSRPLYLAAYVASESSIEVEHLPIKSDEYEMAEV